ncbi:MAG: ABC transporter permease [Rhodospirillaceae bacterium]|nr:ABC transporter permease [Rhodospirillaceae bacterium]
MLHIAMKMLTGDRAKYLGLTFGIAFATLLMSQQVSIFIGLMTRAANQVLDVTEPDIWVMDPRVSYSDEVEALPDMDLQRVRGVPGVGWAVPYYKGLVILRTKEGLLNQISLVGVDDATLVGAPRTWLKGSLDSLRRPDAIVLDVQGADFIWPGEDVELGRRAEINDRRVVVEGIADVSPPFITFPIAYMRYSEVLRVAPPQRNMMSFVLVKAAPGVAPDRLAAEITAQTGLQALTWSDFAWRSVVYYLQRTGIPVNFGITVLLGFIVGAAITGQTFYIFVLENLRQFGALKAVGMTNTQILGMVVAQAAVVGAIGFGLGIGGSAVFFAATADTTAALEGFRLYGEVIAGTAMAVIVILLTSCIASVRRVFTVDPAIVFRG